MAKMMVRNHGPRKPKSVFSRTLVGRWCHNFSNRIFCKRSIIIISDRKTQHVPFAGWVQFAGLVMALGVVGWASYSSGSYMAAQKVLIEKDRKLASSTLENQRVEAEFSLLRRDLMKLAEDSKTGKSAEYAKVIAEQYSQPGVAPSSAPINTVAANDNDASEKYNAVFKRIEYLENKVKDLQSTHDTMISDIRATTGGKIKELEKVIAKTGMDGKPLERAAEAKRNQEEQRREKYGRIENGASDVGGGQGGPFIPAPASALKEKDAELYFNLRQLVTLNDIVTAMPLSTPIASDFHQTSSYGTRVDPFRGSLAFHSGIDLSGGDGAKIIATNNGRVEFAGWKTAYGNVIDIRHEYGMSTRYAHLARVLVQPDQIVKKGQVIGIQGSTGRSTGHHLHYEVRYNGKTLNPANFLKAGDDVRALD